MSIENETEKVIDNIFKENNTDEFFKHVSYQLSLTIFNYLHKENKDITINNLKKYINQEKLKEILYKVKEENKETVQTFINQDSTYFKLATASFLHQLMKIENKDEILF